MNNQINNYVIQEKIGRGAFGETYIGNHKITGEKVAIKKSLNDDISLRNECNILHYFKKCKGIPNARWYGKHDIGNILVMDLLGKPIHTTTLDNINKNINYYALQLIDILEFIHKKGFIHRDIKPENILFDLNGTNKIKLIDFGLAKKIITSEKKHIPFKTNKSITGTVRYCSINVLMGNESSRRDDIESLGYNLLFLTNKRLPWQGLRLSYKDKINKIKEMKVAIKPSDFKIIPKDNIFKLISYSKRLSFTEKPIYQYMKTLFCIK